MHSVRLRITLIAATATAAAISVIAFLLLTQVRSSLHDEIDDSVLDQAADYDANVFSLDDIAFARRPGDVETLFVVLDSDGVLIDANDAGVSGQEVADALDLSTVVEGAYWLRDLSLTTPTETSGTSNMRAAVTNLSNLEEGPGVSGTVFVTFARSLEGVDRTVNRLRNLLLIAVPAVVAFVAALAWWLTGRSLRPVDVMRREVDEISSTDLERRVSEPASRDEIGQLASTMNQMLERLERAQRSQDQFVSDAAHELRTPLASIAAQLDVDATHPESADVAATAANVRSEVSRLQHLIDGLLASARSQSPNHLIASTLLDLDLLASEAVARMSRPTHLTVDERGLGVGTVRGDESALSRLIENLLANAYRHASAHVSVGVGTDAASAWLVVDDDGPGIGPADRERVFERFVRLDAARSADVGGSGLGLALAREAAVAHGGTLHVDDSPLGGARFVLRIPAFE